MNVGKLVERNGKYGRFFGYSNYPQCKFTQKNK
ncbi:MAG: topoisomerase DNA-binding C4 zinc finger domain-containing protein [Bacteroidaceae bacterium]|nr:topoisomerase DNA-binding C4 zinc finger domain-containing protein [Bacteroidaceae bacterium]